MLPQVAVSATVPIYQDFQDNDGMKYTAYILRVQTTYGDSWELRKRYSDFNELHLLLKDRYLHLQEFRFPHKSMFNTMAEYTKLRRLSGFQEYIKLLMEITPRPAELEEFLGLDEHLLNKDGITAVTGVAPTRHNDINGIPQGGSMASSSSSNPGNSTSTNNAENNSYNGGNNYNNNNHRRQTQQQLSSQQRRHIKGQTQMVRIVISSFLTMTLVYWALVVANVINVRDTPASRVALTLLSLGSLCTFMRIALVKREERHEQTKPLGQKKTQ